MRRFLLVLGIALSIPSGLRAEEPVREERRAPDGRLLYARKPGDSPNSERVFDQGTWMTRVYEKADKKLLRRVESQRERHDFTYDTDRVVSRKVRIGESEFSVSFTSNGFVQATGLPAIRLELDAEGNLARLLDEHAELATFKFAPSGAHSDIRLHGNQRLVTNVDGGRVRQTLHDAKGAALYSGEFTPDSSRGGVSRFNLDLIHDDLGLPTNWGNGLYLEPSPTGFSDAIRRKGEEPLAWIVRGIPVGRGSVDVVCRADGRPVAYEILAVSMMGGMPAAPWRVQVTPDGGVSLEAPNGPPGCVIAFWLRAGVFGFRVDSRSSASDRDLAP